MTVDRRLVPFKHWHFDWMQEASSVSDGTSIQTISSASLKPCENMDSWTGVIDGRPIGCAGVVQHWPGRYVSWAYLGLDTGPHMRWITRCALAGLERTKGRIEMTVRADFPAGQRWAEMLGFQVETPRLEAYGPEGEDHVGYVRINR